MPKSDAVLPIRKALSASWSGVRQKVEITLAYAVACVTAVILIAAVAAVAIFCGLAGMFIVQPSQAPDSLIAASAKELYMTHCASCHGANLEGQPDWKERKPDGRLPAPPHDASGHTWHHSDEQLLRITKLGTQAIVGGGYKSDMRGFGDVLSDSEIRAVLGYIKSTWPERIRKRHDATNKRVPE
jgi:mono/diheme cytochrome c family protein